MPRIYFTAEALDWDTSYQECSESEGEMTDFRGAIFEDEEMERGPMMFIRKVLLRMAGIDVSSNDNFGLMLESNVNVSNKFTTAAIMNLETHNIMRLGTSS